MAVALGGTLGGRAATLQRGKSSEALQGYERCTAMSAARLQSASPTVAIIAVAKSGSMASQPPCSGRQKWLDHRTVVRAVAK